MSDNGAFFGNTEEEQFKDWLGWAERVIDVVSLVSQRASLAVAAVGFATAGARMVGNESSRELGQASLGIAGVFAIWLVAANITGARR